MLSGCDLILCLMRALLCLLFSASILSAQTSAPGSSANSSKAQSKPDLSQEAAIIEQLDTILSYEADGTGKSDNSSRIRLQSSAGVQQYGLLTFPYQKNFQELTINYVRARKPDGTVINTSLDDVQDLESEITRAAPFYSDLREKHVAVKGLAIGDTLEWSCSTRVFKALAANEFWLDYSFEKNAIVREEQFRLEVPNNLYVNVKSGDHKPEVRVENGRKIYLWKYAQLTRPEEDLKEKFARAFHRKPSDIQISSFRNWQEVGDWYNSLQQEKVSPSSAVRAKAEELTKDAKTEEEKARILYDFVSTRFRYIGVAFGIGRYQPHSAADVLDNSYGDCKDKHTLLAALLESVGIHSAPALVSSTSDIDQDVPSPGQFDHVITAVHPESSIVWLDTTSEVAPFGLILQAVRGKQALVVLPQHSKLTMVPAAPVLPGLQEVTTTGSLSEAGELQASFVQKYRGDYEVPFRSGFHRVPQPQWKELVQRIVQSQGYAGTVTDVVASNPEKTSEPFQFSYKYDRKEYPEWADNKRIIPPFPPMTVAIPDEEYQKSGQPVPLGGPSEIRYVVDIKTPPGYKPDLPANADVKTDFAEYHSTYALENGALHATRSLRILANEVPPSGYAKFREFGHKVLDDTATWITFNSKEPGKSGGSAVAARGGWPPGFPHPPDTQAGQLFRNGITQFQSKHLTEAVADFESAAKTDPKIPGVWFAIGAARLMLGDVQAGLEGLRRQAKETPDEPAAWRGLAFALMDLKYTEEAVTVLKKWNEKIPNDRDAPANLGRALLTLKRYQEAIKPLEKAAELNADSELVQFQLGNAYYGTDEFERAFKYYAKSIELAGDKPAYENDVAYNLARKKVHLEESQRWAEDAVRELEKETLEIKDLDELDIKHIRLMSSLAAYWDTLGYIYYLRADYLKAERYLRSSWDLDQFSVVAEHLGDVYAKTHDLKRAVRFYSLAANSSNPSDEVQDKLFRLTRSGIAEPPDWRPREELGRMRTLHLPQFGKQHTSAEFMIMLSNKEQSSVPVSRKVTPTPDGKSVTVDLATLKEVGKPGSGKVVEIKFISGSEQLRGLDKLLREKNMLTQFPDESPANLFRRGILMCGGYLPDCQFTLLTADVVRSAN